MCWRAATKLCCCLTWINRTKLVLDHSDHAEARHHSDANQLQADVQPLHGGVAKEQAALVLLQTFSTLLLKPGRTERIGDCTCDVFEDTTKLAAAASTASVM